MELRVDKSIPMNRRLGYIQPPERQDHQSRGVAVNQQHPTLDRKAIDQRKLNRFGWALAAIAVFMFVSFIVKTALRGP